MTTEGQRFTYDQLVAQLPESNQPCELWDGEIVMSPTPSFYHQEIALTFYRALFDWVQARKLGKLIAAPIDMVLSPRRVVQPDVAFISQERLSIIQRVIMGPADLVAEVISTQGRTRDRIEKRDLYAQYGIKEYWLIDPESQMVEVLSLDSGSYRVAARHRRGDRANSTLLPGFGISLDTLYGE